MRMRGWVQLRGGWLRTAKEARVERLEDGERGGVQDAKWSGDPRIRWWTRLISTSARIALLFTLISLLLLLFGAGPRSCGCWCCSSCDSASPAQVSSEQFNLLNTDLSLASIHKSPYLINNKLNKKHTFLKISILEDEGLKAHRLYYYMK